jgi:putative two-component system response regulator
MLTRFRSEGMMRPTESDTLGAWLSRARVLIVDDAPANLTYLQHVLETEGYGDLITLSDPNAACERLTELDPDLIIVDLWMRATDGFGFVARVQQEFRHTYLPVLATTSDPTPAVRRRALSLGARDCLTKPLSSSEVRLRVHNLLETRFLHEQLRQRDAELDHRAVASATVQRLLEERDALACEVALLRRRLASAGAPSTGAEYSRASCAAGRLSPVLHG